MARRPAADAGHEQVAAVLGLVDFTARPGRVQGRRARMNGYRSVSPMWATLIPEG